VKEVLVTCPMCGQAGFTTRGLRSHWCDRNGKKALPEDLVRVTVRDAIDQAALDKRVDARVAHGSSRRRWFGQQMRGGAK
jgi:hypothetical protein